MNDMHMTWTLRAIVFVVSILTLMFAIGFADVNLERLGQWVFGIEFSRPIETGWFWATMATAVWGWIKRKVWIGSQAQQS